MIQIYTHSTHFLTSLLLGLANPAPLSLLLSAVSGVLAGMLINYLADVLPESRRFSKPRCPECEVPFSFKDYLLLRKCPQCENKLSGRNYFVLVGAVLASVLLQFFPFAGLSFWATLPLMIFLGTILVIDMEHRLVLIETSLFGIIICLIYGLILRTPMQTLLGGLNGFLFMLVFYVLGIIFTVLVGKLRGKKVSEVAFGFGDVLAGTFLGLLTGWPGILGAIILALLIFSIFSILLLLGLFITKRYKSFTSAQPLVPFLVLGAVIMLYL